MCPRDIRLLPASDILGRWPIQVERIFRAMDLNQGGEVDLHEFLAATLSRDNGLITASSPSLGAAFSLLDRDGDGFLTRDDLVSLLGSNTTDFPQVMRCPRIPLTVMVTSNCYGLE